MHNAILFDLDGTLVDSLGFYLQAHQKTLKGYNIRLTPAEIVRNCFGVTEQAIADKFGLTLEQFRAKYLGNVRSFMKHVRLFPHALEILNLAKDNGIKLAVMSFAYSWYVKEILSLLKIRDYFQSILGFNDVTKPKPDPEIVLKSCEILGVAPQGSLSIGDAKSDITMGKAAGTRTALFIPKQNSVFYDFADLKQTDPDFVIEDLGELRKLIN